MAEEWTMIRVRKSTQARLASHIDRLTKAESPTATPIGDGWRERVTYDALIVVLLTRDERHRQRKLAHAKSKRRKCRAKSMYTYIAQKRRSLVTADCY